MSDQWIGEAPIFEKWGNHTLGIGDFFAQHNEHRIAFPRLIMLGVGLLTGWNIKAELVAVWALLVMSGIALYRLAMVTNRGHTRDLFGYLLAGSILFFSPLQHENLLWGFQIGFMLPILMIIACLWLVCALEPPINFAAAGVVSTICTFSIVTGFVCWLLAIVLLAFTQRTSGFGKWTKSWATLLMLFITELALYFWEYVKPPEHPSVIEIFKHPASAAGFYCAFFGGAVGGGAFHEPVVACWLGASLLGVLVGCGAAIYKNRGNRLFLSEIFPWLLLGCFSLLIGLSVTIGRLGFGIEAALVSRYVSFSVLLPVSLLFLVAGIFRHWKQGPKRRLVRGLLLAYSLVIGSVFILGAFRNLQAWKKLNHNHLFARTVIQTLNIVDASDLIFPNLRQPAKLVRASVKQLETFISPHLPLFKSNEISQICESSPVDNGRFGKLLSVTRASDGRVVVNGWAVLPGRNRAADAVLLTWEEAHSEPKIFDLCAVTEKGPTKSKLTAGSYRLSGFSRTFPVEKLPEGTCVIKAWAYDAEKCKAYPLQGEGTLVIAGNAGPQY